MSNEVSIKVSIEKYVDKNWLWIKLIVQCWSLYPFIMMMIWKQVFLNQHGWMTMNPVDRKSDHDQLMIELISLIYIWGNIQV